MFAIATYMYMKDVRIRTSNRSEIFLARSRGYSDWIEFRAVATARQNRAVAFDRIYDEED